MDGQARLSPRARRGFLLAGIALVLACLYGLYVSLSLPWSDVVAAGGQEIRLRYRPMTEVTASEPLVRGVETPALASGGTR